MSQVAAGGVERTGLVVTRGLGESVQIGDDVTVTVIKKGNGHTALLIEAPRNVRILRSELLGRPNPKTSGDGVACQE